MWEALLDFIKVIPKAFTGLGTYHSASTTQESLRVAAEQMRNAVPKPWNTQTIQSGMGGTQTYSAEIEEDKKRSEEAFQKQTEDTAKALKMLASGAGALGLATTGLVLGLNYLSRNAEASETTLAKWDVGLARNAAVLERDRMLREMQLSRDTSTTGRALLESANQSEQATQKFREDMRTLGNAISYLWNKTTTGLGKAYEATATLFSGDKKSEQEKQFDTTFRAAELMDKGVAPDEAWKQARKEAEDKSKREFFDPKNLLYGNLQRDAGRYDTGKGPGVQEPWQQSEWRREQGTDRTRHGGAHSRPYWQSHSDRGSTLEPDAPLGAIFDTSKLFAMVNSKDKFAQPKRMPLPEVA